MKNLKFSVAFIMLFIVFSSCANNKTEKDQVKICFAFQDLETEFWVAAHAVITTSLKEKNIEVIERNASQDANRQLEQIRDAIAQEVDGIIFIPQDGQSAITIINEANEAEIPIAVLNRPPADSTKQALVVVADNEAIAEDAVDYMVKKAMEKGRKFTPCILVGDLGDQNSIERKNGFYNAINKQPQIFNEVIEVPTKWDPNTALANFESAMQSNPEIDFVFISSDFLYPQVHVVLSPLGKWKKNGEDGHVLLGGIDGDKTACKLMRDGYVDVTGVQDLYFEANTIISEMLRAIKENKKNINLWVKDPGFVVSQENYDVEADKMWGCR